MTNDEIRRNDEMRMTKPATAQRRVFRHSGFGFLSSFVIQGLVQVRFMVPMRAKKRKWAFNELLRAGRSAEFQLGAVPGKAPRPCGPRRDALVARPFGV